MIEYAEYLGLDLPDDIEYLPLVKEGLTAHLPEEWQACHTPDGELVYRNTKKMVVQYDHPLD